MADAPTLTRLVRVDLFEDRATVLRALPLPAAPGRHTLRVAGVSALAREASLGFAERPGLLVESARVERRLLSRAQADPALAAELHRQKTTLESQLTALRSAQQRAQERARRAEAWADSARSWAGLALVRQDDPLGWVQALRGLSGEQSQALTEALELQRQVADLQADLRALEARLALARQGRVGLEGTLYIQLLNEAGGGELELRYTVPCALWRPVHRALLSGAQVQWEVCAMAWNSTGEDWSGAPARFSTARPGDQPSPPTLAEDLVYTQPRNKQIQVETREEVVQVAREGKARSTEEALGVDDGGEVRVYDAPTPLDLASDGRPVLVPLERFATPAQPTWQCFPEKDSRLALRTRQVNAGRRPLLAGPVLLSTPTGAVGRGRVGLVPPGEPFELGWGTHDRARITRRQDIERSTTRLIGTQHLAFTLTLKVVNLGGEPLDLRVIERVPVSELKEVRVGAPVADPPVEGPDADGFCRWSLRLGPQERRELKLSYTIEAPASVTLPW